MNEVRAIVGEYERAKHDGARTVLATVVRTSGSAYRRPGARMLVRLGADGSCSMTGAISGGCLERDVCERAARALHTNEAALVRYDTTAAEDVVWGLGMGCNGVVEVLLEPLGADGEADAKSDDFDDAPNLNPIDFLRRRHERGERGLIATVFEVNGNARAHAGSRLFLTSDRAEATDIHDAELAAFVSRDARATLSEGRNATREYQLSGGGVASAFLEVVEPPVPLVLFGAGADAPPVARLAYEVGWGVTVVDHRPAFADAVLFPDADAVVVSRPEDVARRVALGARTVAVVMTHNYEHDRELLKTLLASDVSYIGMLGPARRTERMLSELAAEGFEPTAEQRDRLHAPIGLDIGAETPGAIAVSIIAEIQATLAGRAGGPLKQRRAPIHAPAGEGAPRARGGKFMTKDSVLDGAAAVDVGG